MPKKYNSTKECTSSQEGIDCNKKGGIYKCSMGPSGPQGQCFKRDAMKRIQEAEKRCNKKIADCQKNTKQQGDDECWCVYEFDPESGKCNKGC